MSTSETGTRAAPIDPCTRDRHAIMRLLQRADWALKEDDDADALNAVLRAVRIAARMDPYTSRPDGLTKLLAVAMEAAMDNSLDGEGMGNVLQPAMSMLVLDGENYRGCSYGM